MTYKKILWREIHDLSDFFVAVPLRSVFEVSDC